MLKKILISTLSVIIIMIIITGFIGHYVNTVNDYLTPDSGLSYDGLEPEYLFALEDRSHTDPGRMSAVISSSENENGSHLFIYTKEGKEIFHGRIGDKADDFTIRDIRNSADRICILCEEDGTVKLYSVSVTGSSAAVSVAAELDPGVYEQELPEYNGAFIPDTDMRYIALTGGTSAVLYDTQNEHIKNIFTYEKKQIISGAVLTDDMFVIIGAYSEDRETNNFSRGFAEAFSNSGELLWSRDLFDHRNCVSAAMEIQQAPDGSIEIYGRYFDYSESDIILSSLAPDRFDELRLYGHGADYYIYTGSSLRDTGESVQSSAFITELDPDGNETETRVYSALNDFRVPSILNEKSLDKLDKDGKFRLAISRAAYPTSKVYYLTVDDVSVEIPSDVKVLYTQDKSGGIYAYMTESSGCRYKMKYFTSAADFSENMTKLRSAMTFASAADKLPEAMLWFALLSLSAVVTAAKNSWRNNGRNE